MLYNKATLEMFHSKCWRDFYLFLQQLHNLTNVVQQLRILMENKLSYVSATLNSFKRTGIVISVVSELYYKKKLLSSSDGKNSYEMR